MNDNDKPDFSSKLSLVSINEDVANNQLKMVCPKCGYKPKDPSDPLLTKHNGLGECPKCGVIPKKHLQIKESQKNPTHLQQKEMKVAVDHHRRDRKDGKLRVLSIAIGVVLVFGVFSLLKPKDQSKSANESTERLFINLAKLVNEGVQLSSSAEFEKFIIQHPQCCNPHIVSLAKENKLFKDGWGREIRYAQEHDMVRFRSAGPDGIMDTADDLIFPRADSYKEKYPDGISFKPQKEWLVKKMTTKTGQGIDGKIALHFKMDDTELEEYFNLARYEVQKQYHKRMTDSSGSESAEKNFTFWGNAGCSTGLCKPEYSLAIEYDLFRDLNPINPDPNTISQGKGELILYYKGSFDDGNSSKRRLKLTLSKIGPKEPWKVILITEL